MDINLANKEDLLEFANDIRDINKMCEYTLNNNLKEFHIYLDHPMDVPILLGPDPVDDPIPVDSSSFDSYESAEDEAYKPSLPGYKSDSNGGSSPKKPIRKKILTPKKKRRFVDKRTKKHVLSGEGPAGAGSGRGNGPFSYIGPICGPEIGISNELRSVGDENPNASRIAENGHGSPNVDKVNVHEEEFSYEYASKGFKTHVGSDDERGPNGPNFNEVAGFRKHIFEGGLCVSNYELKLNLASEI
ncbi:hypothetical protein PIB30_006947 [Stylosanthes scabra]|uniref:Uncharacterized protein n=1 Tax=Stylosanthes scabra TaxID=79078 RepID=A0ABU6Y3T2_9FABA|nr:hypothetical protein [Stylosanthes scabra]